MITMTPLYSPVCTVSKESTSDNQFASLLLLCEGTLQREAIHGGEERDTEREGGGDGLIALSRLRFSIQFWYSDAGKAEMVSLSCPVVCVPLPPTCGAMGCVRWWGAMWQVLARLSVRYVNVRARIAAHEHEIADHVVGMHRTLAEAAYK